MREDGRVDTDEFAAIVHQRAAGIARINWRIGLNEIFIVFDAQIAAIHGADNSHGDGLPDAKWIANGECIVANLYFGRISDGDWWEIATLDFQDGDVRFGIGAYDFGLQVGACRQG